MDTARIQNLWMEAQASLATFQSTKTEASRIEALEIVTNLARSLEKPRDAILKLTYTPAVIMAMKIAVDLGVFPVLANAMSPIPAEKLAAVNKADPLLVERIMRVLVSCGIVEEPAPCAYLPTAIAKQMTNRPSIGVVESLFCEFNPIFQKTPEYLQAINYRNPEDPTFAPLQYTHNVKQDGFFWLQDHPAALTRFNDFMEGHRANRPHWGDWYPVQERIIDGAVKDPRRALLVDIGGGRGHDLMLFRDRFPDAPGKLVLEDLPSVVDEATQTWKAAGIEAIKHDFFKEPNPVRGARAYYFKYIFHDWSDDKARILLRHFILPDRNARMLHGVTDMAVMAFCAGMERTRAQWKNLLEPLGLETQFWTCEGDGLGVIEAAVRI
ncbi:S-adenosyl-L-methionine-dependent methyltransferase [Aspergillus ambiguus]|uniref:S-adenosyl-L-methionine-dependent methyltransferase n=1 Tax=Aspergillus ambiguus TaxID=176160 RepID=UPI003CCE41A2